MKYMKRLVCFALLGASLLLAACSEGVGIVDGSDDIAGSTSEGQAGEPSFEASSPGGFTNEQKGATEVTIEANNEVYSLLDFTDEQEMEFAQRGLIDAPETLELKDEEGNIVWSQDAYAFLEGEAPDTANPSLWRNAQMNSLYGLFEVVEGVYQVRGYDMANLTLIRGETGWIVFDTMMSVECSAAAMQLVEKNFGKLPVVAVLISHSHIDHYGGIKGIVSEEDVADAALSIEEQLASGKAPVIVPGGFTEHAVSENIYAGNAMGRRAQYQYGTLVEGGEQGSLAIGIGMGQSSGTTSFIKPTYEILETGQQLVIDGISMTFQLTPGTEAPAEMNTYFPDFRALWMAENCTGTMHNLYTLRGAKVRDGNEWAKFLTESYVMFGTQAEVVFQSHNWPHWGQETIYPYIENTAAVYKYINDQTLLYINQGYTMNEIANMIKFPEEMEKVWYTRQYYGTVSHNAKAVYQKYMGWYDANPVHLGELAPEESAKKFVEYMGSEENVLARAKEDFENGEYQWVAQVTNILVYNNPENTDARYLCADALEQLGYMAESGTWRNAYLCAAYELRNGTVREVSLPRGTADTLLGMTPEMFFDYLGILIDGEAAQHSEILINFNMTDTGEQYYVHLLNGALLYFKNATETNAMATVTCDTDQLFRLLNLGTNDLPDTIEVEGNRNALYELLSNVQTFDNFFNIVEP